MRRLCFLLGLLALFTGRAEAQYVGVSSYAAMHPAFPCAKWLSIYDEAVRRKPDLKPAMTVLWGTFGDDLSCVKNFTARFADRPHFLEIHFSNGACRRNHRCLDGEFLPELSDPAYSRKLEADDPTVLSGEDDRLVDIYLGLQQVANANTHIAMVTELEGDKTAGALAAWEGEYWRIAGLGIIPPWPLVVSELRTNFVGNAQFVEFHSLSAKLPKAHWCIANEDGHDQSASGSRKFLRHYAPCTVRFLWRARHQGIVGSRFIPPKKRRFTISDRDVKDFGALLAGG